MIIEAIRKAIYAYKYEERNVGSSFRAFEISRVCEQELLTFFFALELMPLTLKNLEFYPKVKKIGLI